MSVVKFLISKLPFKKKRSTNSNQLVVVKFYIEFNDNSKDVFLKLSCTRDNYARLLKLSRSKCVLEFEDQTIDIMSGEFINLNSLYKLSGKNSN